MISSGALRTDVRSSDWDQGPTRMRQPVLSIRNVLIAFGVLSTMIATGLASFGLLAMQLQRTALERVILLEQVLHNHSTADAFMDSLRTDVLRALQDSAGANKARRRSTPTSRTTWRPSRPPSPTISRSAWSRHKKRRR